MAVLSCWKHIAQYLGTSVRSSQRWASERGLPIRRDPNLDKPTVFAISDELDLWIRNRPFSTHLNELEMLRRENADLRAQLRRNHEQVA